jgi:hypothetical protein
VLFPLGPAAAEATLGPVHDIVVKSPIAHYVYLCSMRSIVIYLVTILNIVTTIVEELHIAIHLGRIVITDSHLQFQTSSSMGSYNEV